MKHHIGIMLMLYYKMETPQNMKRTEGKKMMKDRNYLLVLVSLAITGIPALAVDYVACREMLTTKNEMMKKIEIMEEYHQKIKMPYEKQKFFNTTKVPEFIISTGCPKNDEREEIAGKTDILSKDEWCRLNLKNNYIAKLWVEEEKTLYGKEFILKAKNWIRAATKVNTDMEKAGCPYR